MNQHRERSLLRTFLEFDRDAIVASRRGDYDESCHAHGVSWRALASLGMGNREARARARELGISIKPKRSPRAPSRPRKESKRLRFQVLHRDGFRCVYCGATASAAQLHVDHVVPLSRGGADDASNLVTACADCNLGKHAATLTTAPDTAKV